MLGLQVLVDLQDQLDLQGQQETKDHLGQMDPKALQEAEVNQVLQGQKETLVQLVLKDNVEILVQQEIQDLLAALVQQETKVHLGHRAH